MQLPALGAFLGVVTVIGAWVMVTGKTLVRLRMDSLMRFPSIVCAYVQAPLGGDTCHVVIDCKSRLLNFVKFDEN
jgi:hypothetical protein